MADLTTLGITIGYAIEETAGTRPTTGYKQLERCSAIGGISLETEQIDVSALEDYISQYAAGRQDTGGSWPLTFNLNPDVVSALETLFSSSKTAKEAGKATWFEVIIPGLEKGFFVAGQLGTTIPLPELEQNSALTIEVPVTISKYQGLETKVAFTTD